MVRADQLFIDAAAPRAEAESTPDAGSDRVLGHNALALAGIASARNQREKDNPITRFTFTELHAFVTESLGMEITPEELSLHLREGLPGRGSAG